MTSRMTINGVSTCTALGTEKYEKYYSGRRPRKAMIQYDYRHTDGELFSTVAPTLEQCREKRNLWLNNKESKQMTMTSRMTINGVSTCTALGTEKYEKYYSGRRPRKAMIQYDYRHTDGELFSTVAPTLEQCREKRNLWLNNKESKQ